MGFCRIIAKCFVTFIGSCWRRKGRVWQGNSLIIYVFLFSIWNRVDLLWNLQGSLFISFVQKGRSSRFNSASVCVTRYVAWHQHRGNNMLWRQNHSLEFFARWWIIGSINPSNKFFVRTKQTNSLTWMILWLGCVQWKSLGPYSVVWLEIASFVDQTKIIQLVRGIWSV